MPQPREQKPPRSRSHAPVNRPMGRWFRVTFFFNFWNHLKEQGIPCVLLSQMDFKIEKWWLYSFLVA